MWLRDRYEMLRDRWRWCWRQRRQRRRRGNHFDIYEQMISCGHMVPRAAMCGHVPTCVATCGPPAATRARTQVAPLPRGNTWRHTKKNVGPAKCCTARLGATGRPRPSPCSPEAPRPASAALKPVGLRPWGPCCRLAAMWAGCHPAAGRLHCTGRPAAGQLWAGHRGAGGLAHGELNIGANSCEMV